MFGRAAGEGGIEELAVVEADVDDDGVGVSVCARLDGDAVPDLPSSFFIEVGELEGLDMGFGFVQLFLTFSLPFFILLYRMRRENKWRKLRDF